MFSKLGLVLPIVLLFETTDALQCIQCNNVSYPSSCTKLTTCQPDEICGIDDRVSGQIMHTYGCMNARMCTSFTQLELILKRCEQHPGPANCVGVKRATISITSSLCLVCCGDNLCNKGTCLEVIDHLYKLYVNGTLDMNTLKATSTSSSAGTIVG